MDIRCYEVEIRKDKKIHHLQILENRGNKSSRKSSFNGSRQQSRTNSRMSNLSYARESNISSMISNISIDPNVNYNE